MAPRLQRFSELERFPIPSRPTEARRSPVIARKKRSRRIVTWTLALVALALVAIPVACRTTGTLTQVFSTSPWESYADGLRSSGLDESAVGRAWLAAAARSLASPAEIRMPAEEVLFFDPATPAAASWRLELERGQRLTVAVAPEATAGARVFVDLFRAADSPEEAPQRVAGPEPGEALRFEVKKTGPYLLRLQPELLAGGRFTVLLTAGGSLAFPVAGEDSRAVGSRFGDSRDGGRRRHDGVDIFADRGTAALAAADGRVVRVGSNRLGGNVVWLSGMGGGGPGLTFYYAHLDSHSVSLGQRLAAGQEVGKIGNTGNARSTPPHLHFGVYDNGAVDPYPYIHRPRRSAEPPTADLAPLGDVRRIAGATVNLRSGPGTDHPVLAALDGATLLTVVGARDDWYRVRLPDSVDPPSEGFVAAALTEPVEPPLTRVRVRENVLLRARPSPESPAIADLGSGEQLSVLGTFGDYRFVEADSLRGWLPDSLLQTPDSIGPRGS